MTWDTGPLSGFNSLGATRVNCQGQGGVGSAASIRKRRDLRPILGRYFSELRLQSFGLPTPFQAECEGSIPFPRFNRPGRPPRRPAAARL